MASAPNTKPVHQSQTPRRVSQGSEQACSLLSDGTSIVRSFSEESIRSEIVRVVLVGCWWGVLCWEGGDRGTGVGVER